jgi:Kdo2-lipid IVA lauroyltransferase/acyltransferase
MAEEVRLKHRAEYAAFRLGIAAGRLLSDSWAARVGEALGRTGYRLGIKRQVVERNLRTAFPDRDDAWIRATALASYAHLGRETMMMLRLSWTTREQLVARTHAPDEAVGRSAYLEGRGVIVVSGHIGNWEIGAAIMAVRGYPVAAIAKRASNPLFYRRIQAARRRLGVSVIDFEGATRPTLQALRDGSIVAFAADQHAGPAGVVVPFFGRPAATYRGPAVLALRTGAPMLVSVPLRLDDGTYELRLEPVDTTPSGDMEADVLRVTAAYTARLEQWVREYPEQYLWHHRRWRALEPAEQVTSDAV